MKIVKDVLDDHAADCKKLKVLKEKRKELERVLNARRGDIRDVEQIDDKVREIDRQIKVVCAATIRRIFDDICDEDETSLASSSSSELPEDETLSSNGGGQKQTVMGQGGIGQNKIINSHSKIKLRYKNIKIENNYYHRRRKRKETKE